MLPLLKGENSKLSHTSIELKYFHFPQNKLKLLDLAGLSVVA